MRPFAEFLSLYERAPLRQLLDLDSIGALDWVVVAAGRRVVKALDAELAATLLEGAEASSKWRGNLVFGAFWLMLVAGAVAGFAIGSGKSR